MVELGGEGSAMTRIGIIICDRWRRCAGGKCLRALRERAGAFARYAGDEVEVVGYTTCDGCPGGNVEYAPAEMRRNGAEVVHLATGLLVGYPPCPYIDDFARFIEAKYGMAVVVGTHPIPQSYFESHLALGTWTSPAWQAKIEATLTDEPTRRSYD
jgi:predicted metal-binding protein